MDAASIGDDWSERTRARYLRSWRIIDQFDPDALADAIERSTRPNGSFNVSQFERCADGALMRAVGA